MRTALRLAGALGVIAALPSESLAQIRASELASVSQTVDGTRIAIEYSRPRVRGRKELFGTKLIKWNEVWTPGANYATTFETNRDITLDGHAVPRGKYSVWMVVRQKGPWTFVLDRRARLFHMEHPDSTSDQIRFDVRTQTGPFTEVLTWSFPDVSVSGTTLEMWWATTRVSVAVGVQPSLTVELPATDAAPFLGRYTFQPMTRQDSAKSKQDALVVTYEKGIMRAQFDPIDDYMGKFALIRIGPDTFAPGLYDEKGALYEVLRPDMIFEFARTNGRGSSLEMRDDQDKLQGRAERDPK
jgi:Protein of unknown function (DUF2911)